MLTDEYVCEASANPPWGDVRPPGMYMYNHQTGLTRLNDLVPLPIQPLVQSTLGIRSAGSHNGVAYLAGPGFGGSVNIFAFNADTGSFLGATQIAGYSNVRKWLVGSDNKLYVGLGGGALGGAVWRWTGPGLFEFEEVGVGLDDDAAELTEHDGRIFVNTWPGGLATAGLWMSPPLAQLSAVTSLGAAAPSGGWEKVWDVDEYEPDPVTARTYGGGALASFDGWLYWGTMHVPGMSLLAHDIFYGPAPDEDAAEARFLGTWRAISVFRGRSFNTPEQEIELLYGGQTGVPLGSFSGSPAWFLFPIFAPRCNPFNPGAPRSWQTVLNKMGQVPTYGSAGFDNVFNNYCWTMSVLNDALYVGTMDCSFLILGGIDPSEIPEGLEYEFGADLYRMASEAAPVSLDGMGNPTTYGIRTMVSDDNALYLGTSNPMNLHPDGGWELIELISLLLIPGEEEVVENGVERPLVPLDEGDGGGCFIESATTAVGW
ncbi:MAG: hypothetical protein JRF69_13770 [Deltaproteobacteria bacterium]|nr:hypothetical protein [Deltaproteobacteria bacterium]